MLIPTTHLPFGEITHLIVSHDLINYFNHVKDDVQLVDDDDYCHALLQMRLVNLWLVDDYMIKHTNSKFLSKYTFGK